MDEQYPLNRLHNVLLILIFLNDNKNGTSERDRNWIKEKSSKLNELVYFKDVLTSKWKPGDVVCWGRAPTSNPSVCKVETRKIMNSRPALAPLSRTICYMTHFTHHHKYIKILVTFLLL